MTYLLDETNRVTWYDQPRSCPNQRIVWFSCFSSHLYSAQRTEELQLLLLLYFKLGFFAPFRFKS